MPSVVRHGQGLTVKYSDYVRQDGFTVFVSPDGDNGGVHVIITSVDQHILYEHTLTRDNARMLAHFLQQHADRMKP